MYAAKHLQYSLLSQDDRSAGSVKFPDISLTVYDTLTHLMRISSVIMKHESSLSLITT